MTSDLPQKDAAPQTRGSRNNPIDATPVGQNPFRQAAPKSRPTLQIGISAMLLLVIVSAVFSGGLVYAARIPEIQEEFAVLFGTEVTAERTRRGPQILFILFTLTSPLLLAGILSTVMALQRTRLVRSLTNR